MKRILSFTAFAALGLLMAGARTQTTLTEGWQFAKGHGADADACGWKSVRVPHDWAIYGPFDRANDLQTVAVEQNGEREETVKTGRTGGLPFIGKGSYRRTFEVADTAGKATTFVFDGAMSNAHVYVNGTEVAQWPYGYNSFYFTVPDSLLRIGSNEMLVELENFEQASRWYPGAGLYRNVHQITTSKVHIPVWGTYVTTPIIRDNGDATVRLEMKIEGASKHQKIGVDTRIIAPDGRQVAENKGVYTSRGQNFTQSFLVDKADLWSPENPALYKAVTTLTDASGEELDSYTTTFGIRKLEFVPEKGFFLNGKRTMFKGVCNHHDLGPLGAAVNRSALRHQLTLLKDMGCNAIRTSHNMPAPELVELCDEMGIMLQVEPFDDWGFRPKSPNGYGAVFDRWAQRDITNMVEHYRNNPSVVMWSIGNEVPSQWGEPGMDELVMLRDLVRSLDPTRPISAGMDQIGSVLDNGFAAALDIPGFNYKPQYYEEAYAKLPQKLILATESASTVSSRGKYFFPVEWAEHNTQLHPGNHSNSYDNESCSWSNTPDLDFAADEDHPWVIGQFVWTGFDYLGEPSPYDTDAWPSHSSYFGIIDLASLPKDRFYLYRSLWNDADTTLHILPHWNWEGREGQTTPVFVYTNFPSAELFINGESQGVRHRNDSTVRERFRLMWNDAVYTPGELTVVAYDDSGKEAARRTVRTAGKPYRLTLKPNRSAAAATGDELVYFTVGVEDRDGNPVPTAENTVKFTVEGAGSFEATANGDPTCLMPFQNPEMKLFSGAATAIVRAADTPGKLTLKASAKGLKPASYTIDITDIQ